MKIDLHMHSTKSDGTCSPSQLIDLIAAEKEADEPALVALTDHDTLDGVKEYKQHAQEVGQNITAVYGIEISSDYHGQEIHILGYGIDPDNLQINEELRLYRELRKSRIHKMVDKCVEQGMEIDYQEIKDSADGTIGRPHIAKELLKKGYVTSIDEAFDRYLNRGRSCYVKRMKPSVEEAIYLIKASGGIPVLAHLMEYKRLNSEEKDTLVSYLKSLGLVGIESYYSNYSDVDQEYVLSLARKNGLILTGGSDFHGTIKPTIQLFTGKGHLHVNESIAEEFLSYIK